MLRLKRTALYFATLSGRREDGDRQVRDTDYRAIDRVRVLPVTVDAGGGTVRAPAEEDRGVV